MEKLLASSDKPRLVTYSRTKRKLYGHDDYSIKRRRVVVCETQSDEEEEDERQQKIAGRSIPHTDCLAPETTNLSDKEIYAPATPCSLPQTRPQAYTSIAPDETDTSVKSREQNKLTVVRHEAGHKQKNAPLKKPLVQMQLNLGQPFQKNCKTCGMEYMPSNPEDLALHQKYHAQNIGGVTVSKDLIKKAETWQGIEWTGSGGKDRIMSVSRDLGCQSGRSHVMAVLKIVQTDLGAVDIPYNLLWSLCDTSSPEADCTRSRNPESQAGSVPKPGCGRYKAYLYIHGTKCVGLCLVERINKAYKVVGPNSQESPSRGENGGNSFSLDTPIEISEEADEAFMGISRIWVSSGFRKKGIASALLDCASKTFKDKMATPKDMIAFSQPTQSGARLARRWFGQVTGWHVYTEEGNADMRSKRRELVLST